MVRNHTLCALVLAVATAVTHADDHERTPVSGDLRPLFLQALQQGDAYGVLTGRKIMELSQHWHTTQPPLVDVSVYGSLADPRCKRLKVITRQGGVVDPVTGQAGREMDLTYYLNFCADGSYAGGVSAKP